MHIVTVHASLSSCSSSCMHQLQPPPVSQPNTWPRFCRCLIKSAFSLGYRLPFLRHPQVYGSRGASSGRNSPSQMFDMNTGQFRRESHPLQHTAGYTMQQSMSAGQMHAEWMAGDVLSPRTAGAYSAQIPAALIPPPVRVQAMPLQQVFLACMDRIAPSTSQLEK